MKIATSSASFSEAFGKGLTQLEWLDICANELEVDGVVFDARDFPRADPEYLAQLKKSATDLGLTVAALESGGADDIERHLSVALALGAPLLLTHAPPQSTRAEAWTDFAAATKTTASHAKRLGITLALRAFAGTLCESADDCKRLGKDIDSAWLRFAFGASGSVEPGDNAAFLAKSVIATHAIDDIATFATLGDHQAPALIATLARFRGFVVLEYAIELTERTAYYNAVDRFCTLRAGALSEAASR